MQNTYQPQQSSERPDKRNRARMLISCPDRPGIVAAVSHFLYEHGANIVQSDQYSMDPEGGMFFIRFEFDLTDLERELPVLQEDFARVADRFDMKWSTFSGEPQEASGDLCIQRRPLFARTVMAMASRGFGCRYCNGNQQS